MATHRYGIDGNDRQGRADTGDAKPLRADEVFMGDWIFNTSTGESRRRDGAAIDYSDAPILDDDGEGNELHNDSKRSDVDAAYHEMVEHNRNAWKASK